MDYSTYLNHRHQMEEALKLASAAGRQGEIPVGAIITDKDGNFIASGENRKEREKDPTAHAEIIAIRAASRKLNNWHLNDCTLYVTLEPCPMCAGAIIAARIGLLIYGADDPKTGVIRSVANFPDSVFSNHRLSVIEGILEKECREMLRDWFQKRRSKL
jgi:tRNA(adenine34) deaminase